VSARGRRTVSLGGSILVLPIAAGIGWVKAGEPFHHDGLYAAAAAGFVLAMFAPGLVLSARQLPQLLMPPRILRWWRAGHKTRPHIPVFLRRAVYASDGWVCRWCGSGQNLALDHIKPWAAGGLTVLWNLMTLCSDCNSTKSNYWRWRSGYVSYRPWAGHSNISEAAQILHWELRHRWSPIRWLRAAWYLGS
jgi:hypothetical protein